MSAWRGVDDGAQVRVDWNAQRGSGLLLLNGEDAVVDMLAPHTKNIIPALGSIEPERERQASLCANTVVATLGFSFPIVKTMNLFGSSAIGLSP
jgi:hypothetical protein